MSVGMAIAEKWLAAHYNRPDHTIIDYNIYTLCSDGDMMKGVASEAASLAAHLKLDNLCWIYDSTVTLDGPSSGRSARMSEHGFWPTVGMRSLFATAMISLRSRLRSTAFCGRARGRP